MFDKIIGWFKKPFDPSGDAVNWILWTGLIVVAVFFWKQVLSSIKETV